MFTLDASTIHFASSESAAVWVSRPFQYGSTAIEKSDYLGSIDETPKTSPTYGMYLKTKYTGKDFRVKNLSCSGNGLSFEYIGGMPGDYVMIQAYGGDAFDRDVTGYAAAMRIEHGRGEMSVEMEESSMAKMENYTFKTWMKNPSRVSLAQATRPQTFSFKNGSFMEAKTNLEIEKLPKNLRMFAMKDELTCSWGDLSKLNNLKNIVAGGVNTSGIDGDLWVRGKSCGVNPSNQIIYFGVDGNDKPLRFWIADHGTTQIDNISVPALTLYQVYSDDKYQFDGAEQSGLQIVIQNVPAVLEPGVSFTVSHNGSAAVKFVSTNPHVAVVAPDGTVTIKDYGEFSIVLFSGNQILQTQTFSAVKSNLLEYIPAGDWPKDETAPDDRPDQPDQPGQAVQDAANGLPQTGDSSAAPLWAALLALSLVGLMARRRRSA